MSAIRSRLAASLAVLTTLAAGKAHAAACPAGLEAFRQTLYPLLRANCSTCHGDSGMQYRFAVEDAETAYIRAKPLENFAQIATARMVTVGGRMVPESVSAADLAAATQAWWDQGESGCEQGPALKSLSLPLQALPSAQQPMQTLRWSLKELGEAFKDAFFELDAQQYSQASAEHPGAYLLAHPRLLAAKMPLRIADIQLILNGRTATEATGFRAIDTVVAAQPIPTDTAVAAPHPVLSASGLILLAEKPGLDELSVGFANLEEKPDYQGACKDVASFVANIKPWLPTGPGRACFGCHGGDGDHLPGSSKRAVERLNMDVPDAELCAAFRARIDPKSPSHSPLILLPDFGGAGHTQASASTGELSKEWMPWILGEATP